MKRMIAALILFAASTWAQACEPGLAAKMFVNANDKNGDGVLTASEWSGVDAGGFLVDFKIGEAGEFKRLDNNRNGKIEALELEHAVRFETSPCQGWPWKE